MVLHTVPMSISVEEHSYHTISSTVPMGGLPPGADHVAVLTLPLAPSRMYPESVSYTHVRAHETLR